MRDAAEGEAETRAAAEVDGHAGGMARGTGAGEAGRAAAEVDGHAGGMARGTGAGEAGRAAAEVDGHAGGMARGTGAGESGRAGGEVETRAAADACAALFQRLVGRGVAREQALRAVLGRVAGCFGCAGALATGPAWLLADDLELLAAADWSAVEPAIFGALFQRSMGRERRHALGAHFTGGADIARIVGPTIVRPWQERIAAARDAGELLALREALADFHVLDPACGSGNFLVVAHRELVTLERAIVGRLREAVPSTSEAPRVRLGQLHGIDVDPLAAELARVTLRLGERRTYERLGLPAPEDGEGADIVVGDALLVAWPRADAIVGNPPFQAKNKMQAAFGPAYVRAIRARYPEVSGLADYCVYWFRRAHDALPPGGRAGLVGTNTIRQNMSRAGGLEHIVATGTITDAVASATWAGEAAVEVAIVNWLKGHEPGPRRLSWQVGERRGSAWRTVESATIGASLSWKADVTAAVPLAANERSGACLQGQTHGHAGFLLAPAEARTMCLRDPECAAVIFPFLTANDLLGRADAGPSRWVIDLHPRDLEAARRHREPFARVERTVLPARMRAAAAERARNAGVPGSGGRVNRHHANFLERWWWLSWPRPELVARLQGLSRYLVCGQVTKRPVFAFVDAAIRPNASLIVFPLADDYSFGVLQSMVHREWFTERCSTLTRRLRYTSGSVFDSFPWPQAPSYAQVRAVAAAGAALRAARRRVMQARGFALRGLYRLLEESGHRELEAAQAELDAAVREAYGMRGGADVLESLLRLNLELAAAERRGEAIAGPGPPPGVAALELVTHDRVTVEPLLADRELDACARR